ncbi:MAG: hypothetical protein U0324_04960 [Polyangiales bacterium]
MEILNASEYLGRHVVDVTTALWLGRALLAARPDTPAEGVRESAAALESALGAVAAAHKRQQVQRSDVLRPLHRTAGAHWVALVGRVELCRSLPPDAFPHAAVVERLLALVAPDGSAALPLAHATAWTTLHTRLSLVRDAGLQGALVEVAGAPFVGAVEQSLDALGRALGITAAVSAAADEAMRGLLREFMLSVHDYALQVLATVRRNKPETQRAAQTALRPLEALRVMARRRAAGVEEEFDASDEHAPRCEVVDPQAAVTAPPPACPPVRPSNRPTARPSDVATPN